MTEFSNPTTSGATADRAHLARPGGRRAGAGDRDLQAERPLRNGARARPLLVAFSAEPARYDVLLARMFGGSGDGLSDRLTEFSRPVAGAFYFAPSLNALAEVGGPDEPAA
jgi:putative iron-dependent peroxidase